MFFLCERVKRSQPQRSRGSCGFYKKNKTETTTFLSVINIIIILGRLNLDAALWSESSLFSLLSGAWQIRRRRRLKDTWMCMPYRQREKNFKSFVFMGHNSATGHGRVWMDSQGVDHNWNIHRLLSTTNNLPVKYISCYTPAAHKFGATFRKHFVFVLHAVVDNKKADPLILMNTSCITLVWWKVSVWC